MPSLTFPAPTRRCLKLYATAGVLAFGGCATRPPGPAMLTLPVAEVLRQACPRPDGVEAVRTAGELAAFSVRQEAALAVCDARREALLQGVDAHNALAVQIAAPRRRSPFARSR